MMLLNHGYLYILGNSLMYILSFFAFIIGIKHKKRHNNLSHLFIYPFSSFLQNTISMIVFESSFLGLTTRKNIESLSIHFFILTEFVCIYLFFFKTSVMTSASKIILTVLFVFFVSVYLDNWIKTDNFLKKIQRFYFLDSCLILIPCFLYLFQLFAKPPTLYLLREPSFWFNAGILIYLTLTLPVFFMIDYFRGRAMQDLINDINFIGYCIVFSFLIKAFLCKSKTTI